MVSVKVAILGFVVSLIKCAFLRVEDTPVDWIDQMTTPRIFDLKRFDFYGNPLGPPNRTIPQEHFLCSRTNNSSDQFRKFAGLLLLDEDTGEVKRIEAEWCDFGRMNELKEESAGVKFNCEIVTSSSDDETDTLGGNDTLDTIIDFDNTLTLDSDLPAIRLGVDTPNSADSFISHNSREYVTKVLPKLAIDPNVSLESDLLATNLLLLSIPRLEECSLDSRTDMVGMLILLFLLKVDDSERYFEEFKQFYGFCKTYSNGSLILLTVTTMIDGVEDCGTAAIINELFTLAIQLNLAYTLELFYALDIVNFERDSLLIFFLQNCSSPIVLQRYFDFVHWNRPMTINGKEYYKIHYLHEQYPKYLNLLLEKEYAIVDWSVGDGEGAILLWKLLSSIQESAFFEDSNSSVLNKTLLRNLLKKDNGGILINSKNGHDLLDLCLENEADGLRLLSEFYNYSSAASIEATIKLMDRILEILKSNYSKAVPLNRTLLYLLKSGELDRMLMIPKLIEAFNLFKSRLPVMERSSSPVNRSLSNSSSRSISGDLKKLFSSESTKPSVNLMISTSSSNLTFESAPGTPKKTLETMKMIMEKVEKINDGNVEEYNEMLVEWKAIIAQHQ